MGKNDNRNSAKMRAIKARNAKKVREARKVEEARNNKNK